MNALRQLRRLLTPLLVLALVGGAAFTYRTKHEALVASERVAELRHDIDQERIRLSLLKAEWSELTQPGRIQALVERYPDRLELAPFGIDRMVQITDIPFSPDRDFIADMLATAERLETRQ